MTLFFSFCNLISSGPIIIVLIDFFVISVSRSVQQIVKATINECSLGFFFFNDA